ncbi:MAG: DUF2235 domain-containing protein [Pseudomonadota bacterium]
MGKNIVVFADGTGQKGGEGNSTNVYKTFNLILDRSPEQFSFYDPGLGTGMRKVTGNIGGRGFSENIRQCYEFIFQNFEHGDRIYLFGFSRGAATVRSLTGFIHMFGILPRSRHDLIEQAWSIYKTQNMKKRERRAERFLSLNHTMWAKVHCLCVWDTVAALGIPQSKLDKLINKVFPHEFHHFELSDSVRHAYHALAIDDARKAFHPVYIDPRRENTAESEMKQVWFMGMHTDVGGGYATSGLSDIAWEWMLLHAVKRGLKIHKASAAKRLCRPDVNGYMEDSRKGWWKRWVFKAAQRKWLDDYPDPVVHESVGQRTQTIDNKPGAYEPWILRIPGREAKVEPWLRLRPGVFDDVQLGGDESERSAILQQLDNLADWSRNPD